VAEYVNVASGMIHAV